MQSLDTASISSQGSTLSQLVLSKNHLKDVPTRALKNLQQLDYLDLNSNQIASLHANAFEGLKKVILFAKVNLIDTHIFDTILEILFCRESCLLNTISIQI